MSPLTQGLNYRSGGAGFAGQENDGQRNFRGWKLQDCKMTDKSAGLENAGQENHGQHNRGGKLRDWKLTDKSAAGKNVEHVGLVLTFKNHHTELINV